MKNLSESLVDKILKYIDNLLFYNIEILKENSNLIYIYHYLINNKKTLSYPDIITKENITRSHRITNLKIMSNMKFLVMNTDYCIINNHAFDLILNRLDRSNNFIALSQKSIYGQQKRFMGEKSDYLSGISCFIDNIVDKNHYTSTGDFIFRHYNKNIARDNKEYILKECDLNEICKEIDKCNKNSHLENELKNYLILSNGKICSSFSNKNNLKLFYIFCVIFSNYSFYIWTFLYLSIINYKYIVNEDFKNYFLDKIIINKNVRNELRINLETYLSILSYTEKQKLSKMIDDVQDIFQNNISLNDLFKPIIFLKDILKDISNKNLEKITIFTEQ